MKKEPIDIILVTFNRLNFLKRTVKEIYHRTKYPSRLWVIDNNSTDGTQHWLKSAKMHGYLHDFLFLEKNVGLAGGFTAGFNHIKDKSSNFIVQTQDDLVPPLLTPCWLERMLHLAEKYPDYGGICMRIERTRRRDIDEFKDLIESPTACPSVFRISRKEDIVKMGGFSNRLHWESHSYCERMKSSGKKLAMATHIYSSHIGFTHNKGFEKGFTDYYTYAENKVDQQNEQPYPNIDPGTNIPIKTKTPRDDREQKAREDYYKYWGVDFRIKAAHITKEQLELAKYCEKGKGIDIGCGKTKCHKNCIGVDIHHDSGAEIIHDCRDLWMFKDGELDFVVSSHTLEHMPDFISVIKEWKRILRVGGTLAIAVPNAEKYPAFILRNGHKSNFSAEELRLVFKFVLKMKVIRLETISNNKGKDRVILIVGKKG